MMTAKARGKSRIVVFHENESERPDSPTARSRRRPLDRAPEDAARRLEQAHPAARDRRDRRDTIADELRRLIDYHNCRVFLRDGDDLRPIAFRGDLTQGSGVGARRARDEGRRRCHRSRRRDRRAIPHGRRGQLRDRSPHRGHRPDRGVAARRAACATAPDVVGVLVDLQARTRPVRRTTTCACSRCSRATPPSRSSTRGCTRPQRREAESARRRCSSSRGSSHPACNSTTVVERIARGAARILGVERRPSGCPRTSARTATSSAAEPGRRQAQSARPEVGDRLPAAAAAIFSTQPEPFVVERAEYEHLLAGHFPGALADAYAIVPLSPRYRPGRDRPRTRRRGASR